MDGPRPTRRKTPPRAACAALIALLSTALALLVPGTSQGGEADTVWLCLPGQADNPCTPSLETTVQRPNGEDRVVEPHQALGRSKVDCFWIYPTVSDQPTLNSDRSKDEPVRGMTELQAGYLSRRCNLYAPMYRQVTVPALLTRSREDLIEGFRTAYSDIRSAFLDYWRNHNRGERGFILVGHSQGALMAEELIRDQIDDHPARRRMMLSAIVPGVLPTVPRGELVGGLYDNVPACERRRQLGCVMGWATYDETPPDDTRFGVPPSIAVDAFGWPDGENLEVICTNPAHLKRNNGTMKTIARTDVYAGSVGLAILGYYELQLPQAPTPWVRMGRDRYRAECVRENGAHVLKAFPIGDARDYRPSPDDTWGLHLGDMNLPLGNLLKIIRAQKRKARAIGRV